MWRSSDLCQLPPDTTGYRSRFSLRACLFVLLTTGCCLECHNKEADKAPVLCCLVSQDCVSFTISHRRQLCGSDGMWQLAVAFLLPFTSWQGGSNPLSKRRTFYLPQLVYYSSACVQCQAQGTKKRRVRYTHLLLFAHKLFFRLGFYTSPWRLAGS